MFSDRAYNARQSEHGHHPKPLEDSCSCRLPWSTYNISSFSYETIGLIEKNAYVAAAGNIAINVIAGLGATIIGLAIGKIIVG